MTCRKYWVYLSSNRNLLTQALTHSSYANENPGTAPASNERAGIFGDAILGLIVAENLFRDFPAMSEGEMTRLRSISRKTGNAGPGSRID